MSEPSDHFSWSEFACKDGTPYPVEWRESRGVPLAQEAERVRDLFGGTPLEVRSAYRPQAYQDRLRRQGYRAAKVGRHPEGRALDLAPVPCTPEAVDYLHAAVVEASKQPGSMIRGIGRYKSFVHMDIRPSTRTARWDSRRHNQNRLA